mgnify:CR=1 FL=1
MNNIPEKINAFNVYKSGTLLVGLSDEVTLPDFEAITETLSGPGILGELESVAIGQFSSMEIEIPFRQVDEPMFTLVDQSTAVDLTLRGSIQFTDGSTGATDFKPMRVVVRGKNKTVTGGKVKQGTGTASAVKLEISYILIEIDSKPKIELDKLNFVYKVNGVDLLAKVRKMC